jgi:hypothetical protein
MSPHYQFILTYDHKGQTTKFLATEVMYHKLIEITIATDISGYFVLNANVITTWPLSEALHDDVELGEGEDPVLVLVEQHEDLLELRHLLVSQLPLVLNKG